MRPGCLEKPIIVCSVQLSEVFLMLPLNTYAFFLIMPLGNVSSSSTLHIILDDGFCCFNDNSMYDGYYVNMITFQCVWWCTILSLLVFTIFVKLTNNYILCFEATDAVSVSVISQTDSVLLVTCICHNNSNRKQTNKQANNSSRLLITVIMDTNIIHLKMSL